MGPLRRAVAAGFLAGLALSLPWLTREPEGATRSEVPGLPTRGQATAPAALLDPAERPSTEAQILRESLRWKSYVWAPDEAHFVLPAKVRPENLLPGAPLLEENENRFTVQLPEVDAASFSKRTRELRALGAREVYPVFYPSAKAKRSRGGTRLYLTRQLVAMLPPGADARTLASSLGVTLVARLEFMRDTVLLETREPLETLTLAARLVEAGARAAVPQFAMQPLEGARRATVNDTLYGNQWHLKNTGQGGATPGEDLRVEKAWDVTFGAGSVIGIVDSGLDLTHPDLLANYLPGSSFDFNDMDSDPSPTTATENHGTAVAGCAVAVGNNNLGVSGVAPQAKFGALRVISGLVTDFTVASVMNFSNDVIQIKNNSWSFTTGVTLDPFGHFADLAALNNAAETGRGGKGIIYVFSAMNEGDNGGNVNNSGYCNQRRIITVGSVTFNGVRSPYSNRGSALLVCAPSGGSSGERGLETTDRTGADGYNTSPTGDYVDTTGGGGFSGTSGSAPLVSGVVALMLSANPNLSARDVQHILVRTARKVDLANPSWITNGGGRLVSHDYGHGVADAGAAVQLAGAFPYAPPETSVSSSDPTVNLAIPDSPAAGVSRTLTLPAAGALRVSHVEVNFDATHTWRSDLRVRLVHGGTTSLLAFGTGGDSGDDFPNWQFLSTLHWGESSAGDWTLMVDDLAGSDTGTFNSWTLRVYGTPMDATPPVAGTVNDGTSADLQFQSSVAGLSANWSGFSDPESGSLVYDWAIGTFAGGEDVRAFESVGYATAASATGLSLTPGSLYFVTVRATNFDGLQATSPSNGIRITPETTLTGTPSDPSGSAIATFSFSANQASCTFAYRLDGGPAQTLGSSTSVTISGLTIGTHTFSVFATSPAGYTDPTPVIYTWTIPTIIQDGTAPVLNRLDSPFHLTTFTVSAPSGGVGWAVDAAPATVVASPAFFSGPFSLNYNNGATYFTGGQNGGSVRTGAIDRTGLPGTARLKFMCNYQTDTTGTATDVRTVTIWRGDLAGIWTAPIQLHGGASGLGPCSPMGTWHEHTLDLQAGWSPSLRVEFSFDTVDGVNNALAGWFIDDFEISDLLVSGLGQFTAGFASPLSVGASTSGNVAFQGIVSGAGAGEIRLEVEVQPVGSAFTGTPTALASATGPGTSIGVQIALPPGSYRWRARSVEVLSSTTSSWMEFGLNVSSAPDFIVSRPPGSGGGGGGGCGLLGIGALLPIIIAAGSRRRAWNYSHGA